MKILSLRYSQTYTEPDKDGMSTVTGYCVVTNQLYSINVYFEGLKLWLNGLHIQDALPETCAPDREFLVSGTSPEGWKQMFGDPIEEEIA